jgi:single-stranded DNA-binding protein
MTDFDKTNRGALFKNNRKEQGDKKPEYTGSLNVGGVEYFLDAWLNKSKAGENYMSVSVKRKDMQPQEQGGYRNSGGRPMPGSSAPPAAPARAAAPASSGGFDDMDDDIPF